MEKDLDYIIDRATELYLQYGIRSLTMDDLARELGVSKKTIYQYVTDKADLVGKVVKRRYEHIQQTMCSLPKNLNAIEVLIETNQMILEMMTKTPASVEYDLYKYYPEIWSELVGNRRKSICNQIAENLKQGIEEGLYRSDLNIDIITKIHASRIELKWQSGFFTIEEMMSPEVVNQMFTYHLRGICNNKGIEFFEKKMYELKNK